MTIKLSKVVFNTRRPNGEVLATVEGYSFTMEGITLVTHKNESGKTWRITEYSTGAILVGGTNTRKSSIEAAAATIERFGVDRINKEIERLTALIK